MQKYNAFLSSVNETEELYMALSSSYSQINWAIKSATKNTFFSSSASKNISFISYRFITSKRHLSRKHRPYDINRKKNWNNLF